MEYRVIDKEKLEQLVINSTSIVDIANFFQVTPGTILKHVAKYDNFGCKIFRGRYISAINKRHEQIYTLYLQLNGAKKIGEILHLNPTIIKEILRTNGFKIFASGKWTKVVNHVKNKNFYLPIDSYLQEVIWSLLYGDGCIGLQMQGEKTFPKDLSSDKYFDYLTFLRSFQVKPIGKITPALIRKFIEAMEYISQYPTAQLRLHVDSLSKPYVKYIASLLIKAGYKCNIYLRDKKPTMNSDKNTGFDSSSSVQFFDFYAIWYPNNKKIIPPNPKITPNILLHMFLGDGSFGPNSFYIATQSFTEAEVESLVIALKRDANIDSWVTHARDGIILTLSLKKDNVERFFNYLEKANPEALKVAKEVFPWKFDKNFSHDEYLKKIKNQ